ENCFHSSHLHRLSVWRTHAAALCSMAASVRSPCMTRVNLTATCFGGVSTPVSDLFLRPNPDDFVGRLAEQHEFIWFLGRAKSDERPRNHPVRSATRACFR